MAYTIRINCKKESRLTQYGRYETQVIQTVSESKTTVPFKIWGYCKPIPPKPEPIVYLGNINSTPSNRLLSNRYKIRTKRDTEVIKEFSNINRLSANILIPNLTDLSQYKEKETSTYSIIDPHGIIIMTNKITEIISPDIFNIHIPPTLHRGTYNLKIKYLLDDETCVKTFPLIVS